MYVYLEGCSSFVKPVDSYIYHKPGFTHSTGPIPKTYIHTHIYTYIYIRVYIYICTSHISYHHIINPTPKRHIHICMFKSVRVIRGLSEGYQRAIRGLSEGYQGGY